MNPEYAKDAFGNELVPGSFVIYSVGRRGNIVPAIVAKPRYAFGTAGARTVRLFLRPHRHPQALPTRRCAVVDVEMIPLVAREALATEFVSRETP